MTARQAAPKPYRPPEILGAVRELVELRMILGSENPVELLTEDAR